MPAPKCLAAAAAAVYSQGMMLARTIAFLMAVAYGNPTPVPAGGAPATFTLERRGATARVIGDADDCALWVHPRDPARSIVIGTDKGKKNAGLHVWDLSGHELQFLPVPKPNNVDVRQGIVLGGRTIDVAVCNARSVRELRVFRIDAETRRLTDITTAAGIHTPELADPYGLCLYRRARDGALFVIESTQDGDARNLHQYRLEDDGSGRVRGAHVRRLGEDSIQSFVEGLVADDELGWLYASDEQKAVRKYSADPDAGVDGPLAAFAQADGIVGDREGLALYACGGGRGWLLLSSQGDGTVKVYRREGEPGDPHRHVLVATLHTPGSRATDGLEVTSRALPGFPQGMLAKHDSRSRTFVLYSWSDAARSPLGACTIQDPHVR